MADAEAAAFASNEAMQEAIAAAEAAAEAAHASNAVVMPQALISDQFSDPQDQTQDRDIGIFTSLIVQRDPNNMIPYTYAEDIYCKVRTLHSLITATRPQHLTLYAIMNYGTLRVMSAR